MWCHMGQPQWNVSFSITRPTEFFRERKLSEESEKKYPKHSNSHRHALFHLNITLEMWLC